MKTVKEITGDILQSIGQENNPIGVLLEGYLQKVITDIVKDKLIELQIQLDVEGYINNEEFNFEDKASEVLSYNPVE